LVVVLPILVIGRVASWILFEDGIEAHPDSLLIVILSFGIAAVGYGLAYIMRSAHTVKAQDHASLLNSIFEHFPGGVSYFDGDLILRMANKDFYNLLDLPAEQLKVGCTFEDVIRFNAERGEYGTCNKEEQIQKRVKLGSNPVPHRLKRKTSAGRVLDIKGMPLPRGGFLTTYLDVTEQENTLSELQSKRQESMVATERLRAARDEQAKTHKHLISAINSMRNGFVIWDKDGHLVMANEAFRNVYSDIKDSLKTGLSFGDFLRKGVEAGIWSIGDGNDDIEAWIEEHVAYRNSNQDSEREITLNNGQQLIISERKLDNGDTIVTLIDVTNHRQREAELRDTKDKLEHIAFHDELTTLPNRACCQKDLDEHFSELPSSSKFAIVQIDLDNFKRVNDTMGHAGGDFLLKTVGERLSLFSKQIKSFKPYRWGGDEFIALVERDGDIPLDEICQEVTDLISIPVHFESKTFWPTVSLGIARYPEDGTDRDSLMIFADLALYKTKELGRDGYQFFTSEMKEQVDLESRIESELRIAIEEDQLDLYFQPQISSTDESLTGVEALIRWNHPEHGLVPPNMFLEVSETNGLASQLGCLVFEKAMSAARKWTDLDLDFGKVAINLSPSHLKRASLLDDFFTTMQRFGLDPSCLAVEFVESCLLDDPHADISKILETFRKRGIHVELDDFGTGYASLSHLSNVPIDGIKIDRSFVQNIESNSKEQAIVGVVMSMSKLMQLHVVCEGVETYEQFKAVSHISKCSIQGYMVAKPMSFADMTQWMSEGRNKGLLADPNSKTIVAQPAKAFMAGKEIYSM
jgi:diguanylate cyclase (GGDEF)-like protein